MENPAYPSELKHLTRRLAAHEKGMGAFSNSIWAAFGISSAPARYCERHPWSSLRILSLYTGDPQPEPSPAATKMRQAEIHRKARQPKVALPQATTDALVDYLLERAGLLSEFSVALKLVPGHFLNSARTARGCKNEAASAAKLLSYLASAAENPRGSHWAATCLSFYEGSRH